jgi:MoxR-like ATPase
MDHLILPSNIKSVLLSSLQAYFTAPSSEGIDDIIVAKKRGIIGLLHGPPSTGKTLTVGE